MDFVCSSQIEFVASTSQYFNLSLLSTSRMPGRNILSASVTFRAGSTNRLFERLPLIHSLAQQTLTEVLLCTMNVICCVSCWGNRDEANPCKPLTLTTVW